MKDIDLYKLLNEFNSKKEAYEYFKICPNNYGIKELNNIASSVNFDLSVYKERRKPKTRYCLVCNNILNKNQNKFCSHTCSAKYTNKHRVFSDEKRNEINKKISNTLNQNNHFKIKCLNCEKEFDIIWNSRRNQKFCSISCGKKYTSNTIINKERLSIKRLKECEDINERIRMGEIGRKGGFGKKGYTKNGTYYASILEQSCFEYLEDNNINFEPHKYIPNSSKISDVYLTDSNKWIELDGINREKRKKWLGKNYEYWLMKLKIYEEQKLNYVVVYNLEEFKKEVGL